MSNSAANDPEAESSPGVTIADLLHDVQPMGDLRGFVIDDLSPDEEDEFFRILEEA